jgi:hypothetical protein
MIKKEKIVGSLIYFVPTRLRTKIKDIRILAAVQRALLKYLAPKNQFVHRIDSGPAKGLKLLIRLPNDKNMWKGTYENEFCKRLHENVVQGDVCYDIGAFRGYTAGVLALAGASCVLAFEPMPENQQTIKSVLSLNPDLRIDLFPMAVAGSIGEQSLEINSDLSMNKLGPISAEKRSNEIRVKTVTVDWIAKETQKWPSLLKIDVEGAEVSVLSGAVESLKRSVRSIFLEIHNSKAEHECRSILEKLGFECIWKEHDWGRFANQTMFEKREVI